MKLNQIKTELFFMRRLLQEGYGPQYWWSYIKNRFFGNHMLPNFPQYDYVADPDFEIHTICSKKDLLMLVWMLRSFLVLSELKPTIVIHDDGSLDDEAIKLINKKFSNNIKVLRRDETKRRVLDILDLPDIIKEARRNGHFFLDRLIDIFVLSRAKKLLVLDTDILFYKWPTEVIDFVNGKSGLDALIQRQVNDKIIFDLAMDDYFNEKYKTLEKKVALMNGGFLLFDGEKLNLNQLVEYLTHTKRPFNDYFIEMAGWACVLAQLNFDFLSPETYAIKGFLNDKMVIKHYTSPRRYELFAYGIEKSKKIINEKLKNK